MDRHDRALRLLAMFLEKERLHPVFPKRMSSREEKLVEKRNDELYAVHRRFREDGMRRGRVIETAAEQCGYGRSRGYEIVGLRESASEARAR